MKKQPADEKIVHGDSHKACEAVDEPGARGPEDVRALLPPSNERDGFSARDIAGVLTTCAFYFRQGDQREGVPGTQDELERHLVDSLAEVYRCHLDELLRGGFVTPAEVIASVGFTAFVVRFARWSRELNDAWRGEHDGPRASLRELWRSCCHRARALGLVADSEMEAELERGLRRALGEKHRLGDDELRNAAYLLTRRERPKRILRWKGGKLTLSNWRVGDEYPLGVSRARDGAASPPAPKDPPEVLEQAASRELLDRLCRAVRDLRDEADDADTAAIEYELGRLGRQGQRIAWDRQRFPQSLSEDDSCLALAIEVAGLSVPARTRREVAQRHGVTPKRVRNREKRVRDALRSALGLSA